MMSALDEPAGWSVSRVTGDRLYVPTACAKRVHMFKKALSRVNHSQIWFGRKKSNKCCPRMKKCLGHPIRLQREREKERCSGSYRQAVGFLVIKDDSISDSKQFPVWCYLAKPFHWTTRGWAQRLIREYTVNLPTFYALLSLSLCNLIGWPRHFFILGQHLFDFFLLSLFIKSEERQH